VSVWLFWEYGGSAFLVFAAIVFALAAYSSGLLMWAWFIGPRVQQRTSSQAERES